MCVRMSGMGKMFLIHRKIKPEPARVDQRFWKREGGREVAGSLGLHRVCILFQKQISRTFPGLFQDSD